MKKKVITRLDYCQYLLVSQINYTLTNYAEHHPEQISHDRINRYLRHEKLKLRLVWEKVKDDIVMDEDGYLIFDDSILDKNHSHKTELVNRQYSGNVHRIIKGFCIVKCIYVNPRTQQYWLIDYRIYDRATDGKSKLDHLKDMLKHSIEHKKLSFKYVLMDTWYATKDIVLYIDGLQKIFYCPLKSNRKVDDSKGINPYKAVSDLTWTDAEQQNGKRIKIHGFPKDYKVQLFRVAVNDNRTDWIVTNDTTQDSSIGTRLVCAIRWKIEQFHREIKQLTGIESNQCRKACIQRNHICCSMLVWVQLAKQARVLKQTLYQVKKGLLSAYLREQLRSPSVKFA